MLCTHHSDITREISAFLYRLVARGYSLTHLIPIFLSAEQKALKYRRDRQTQQTNPTQHQQPPTRDSAFLHLQYHPANPPSIDIQNAWRSHLLTPPSQLPFYKLCNRDGHEIDIKRLIIAYSRAPNLGNILSCRILRARIRDYTDRTLHPMLFDDYDDDNTTTTS